MNTETQVFHPEGDVFLLVTRRDEEKGQARVENVEPEMIPLPSDDQVIRMQVSSMHLTVVSPVFKAMLSGRFKEGSILRDEGALDVSLPDDDPEVLTILLNIIHGHSRKVPREVDLHTCTKLAILVDYYQLLEVVEVYAHIWLQDIQRLWIKHISDSSSGSKTMLQCLRVCWIFRHAVGFEQVTRKIVYEFKGNISERDTCDLPIPHSIIEAINLQRNQALPSIQKQLQELESKYLGDAIICEDDKEDCDSMVLGSIVKILRGKDSATSLTGSFRNMSLKSFLETLRKKRVSRLCGRYRTGCGIRSTWLGIFDAENTYLRILNAVENRSCGLKLSDFTETPTKA